MSKRPVSPGAEEILGLYFPVLDHGFVALVDYMGTDECIERAARVSYGYGTRKASLTRGLIRYLRRHLHTTPSEMLELKFHCCMPMFIARQWIRHRSACLAGDAKLWFDLPGAKRRGRRHRHTMTIADFHRLWHEGTTHPIVKKKPTHVDRVDPNETYTIPELARLVERREETLRECVYQGRLEAERVRTSDPRKPSIFVRGSAWHEFATRAHEAHVPMRDRLRRMELRSLDEKTGEIIRTRVTDVWESGRKQVFRVTLDNGYSLKMSKDHRCFTKSGWLTLEEATKLRVGPTGTVSWADDSPAFAVNGQPAYRDRDWLSAKRAAGLSVPEIAELAETSYHTIRKYLRLYDLSHFFADKPRLPRPRLKRLPATTRLTRHFARVKNIELVGEEMTYDIEVEGPFHNFVADGFVVHNSVNEYSGRYSLMPMLFYTPDAKQLQTQSRANNQGRSGKPVDSETYAEAVERWNDIRRGSRSAYEWMTGEDIARELARIDLPLSTYTQWYWKIDLHNFLHFLKLRVDTHAQWEIQEYGRVMAGMLKRVAPLSYEAFIDYDVCGARLSRMELDAIRRLVTLEGDGLRAKPGATVDAAGLEALGLAKREARELLDKLASTEVPDFELSLSSARPAEEFAERFAKAVPKVDKAPSE